MPLSHASVFYVSTIVTAATPMPGCQVVLGINSLCLSSSNVSGVLWKVVRHSHSLGAAFLDGLLLSRPSFLSIYYPRPHNLVTGIKTPLGLDRSLYKRTALPMFLGFLRRETSNLVYELHRAPC